MLGSPSTPPWWSHQKSVSDIRESSKAERQLAAVLIPVGLSNSIALGTPHTATAAWTFLSVLYFVFDRAAISPPAWNKELLPWLIISSKATWTFRGKTYFPFHSPPASLLLNSFTELCSVLPLPHVSVTALPGSCKLLSLLIRWIKYRGLTSQ